MIGASTASCQRARPTLCWKPWARARRTGHALSLSYLDLDGFKSINDERGHDEGDRVLKAVAEVLRDAVRVTDTAARLGGDEFAVLLPETGLEQARVVVRKLRERLLARMEAEGWPVTVSIGTVSYARAPASVDELVSRADELMYGVKKSGKNGTAERQVS